MPPLACPGSQLGASYPALRSSGAAILASLVALSLAATTSTAACIDYQDYIHAVGSLDMDAPSDLGVAGNYAYVADQIDGLMVLDITNPHAPSLAGSLSLAGNQQAIAVSGQYAYLAWFGSFNTAGLHVVNISNPASPALITTFNFTGSPQGLALAGGYAYVAAATSGVRIINVSNPANPTLAGTVVTANASSVEVSGSYAYVADNETGMLVVDVTNPASPEIVASHNTPGFARGVALAGAYAYIADSNAGMHVVDVSNPAVPSLVGTVVAGVQLSGVATSGSHAYVTDNLYGLFAIDVSTPSLPFVVGSAGVVRGSSVRLQGDYAYTEDFQVIDISNPVQASILGSLETEDTVLGIAVAGSFAYMVARPGNLLVIDVSDHTAPVLTANLDLGDFSPTEIAVRPPYAYLSTWGRGLHVVDISNPAAPSVVGSVDTPFRFAMGVAVAGNYAYVVDPHPVGVGPTHFLIIDVSNPTAPAITGDLTFPYNGLDVAVHGNHAYVGGHDAEGNGFRVFDVTNPQSPAMIAYLSFFYIIDGVAVDGTHAYFSHDFYMGVADVSNPTVPELLGTVQTPRDADGIAIAGDHAYVAVGPRGVAVIDVSDPKHPRPVGGTKTLGWAFDIAVADGLVYVAEGSNPPTGRPGLSILPTMCGATSATPSSWIETMPQPAMAVWPNPAPRSAMLRFELPVAGAAQVDIYDLTGRWVRQISRNSNAPAGPHEVLWDGRNERGLPVASGAYIARLTGDGGTTAVRFTLLR